MAVVKNLMVRAGMDASGIAKGSKQAQSSMNNLQRGLSSSMTGINKTLAFVKTALLTLGISKIVKDATQVAVSFESSFGQINRLLGENANEFKSWAAQNAKSYGMSLSEAYKYGATFSNLVSSFTQGTGESAQYTEQLLKASSIVASATGRTMEDTMDRIRSGILGSTEAIEDLGIYAQVGMLETTKAFRQLAGDRSWQQLTFQEQQQIRVMSILEQASSKYGDTLANNTATRQMQFVASLKNVQLALGQAFIPIYNVILPALTSFMNGLATVLGYVAQFTTALFGSKVTKNANNQSAAIQGQAGAVDDLASAYDGAGASAKKAQGFLAGFDEINSMSKADSSGGNGGSGVGSAGIQAPIINSDSSDGAIVKISNKVQELVNRIKSAFKDVANFISNNWTLISSVIAGAVSFIAALFIGGKWTAIAGAIAVVIDWITLIPTALGVAFLSISWPVVGIAAAIGAVVAAIVYLWQTSESFRKDVMTIVDGIIGVLNNIWNNVLKPLFAFIWDVFVTILVPLGKFFAQVFVDAVAATFKVLSELWKNILEPIANFIVDIFAMAIKGLIEIWQAWKPVIDVVFTALMWIYNNAIKPIAGFIAGALTDSIKSWGAIIQSVISVAKGVFQGLIDFIVGVFTGNWSKALSGLVTIFSSIMNGIKGAVKGPLNSVITLVNQAISGINKLMDVRIPSWVPLVGGKQFGFTIPQIPYLAKGGIVNSATLAMVGENGREAVMPLENNTGWINELASKINNLGSNNSGPINVILQVGQSELGRACIKAINRETEIAGTTLLTV